MKRTVYLQLEERWTSSYKQRSGHPPDDFRAVAVFTQEPKNKTGIIVALDLDIAPELFMPIKPKVDIKLEQEDVTTQVQINKSGVAARGRS